MSDGSVQFYDNDKGTIVSIDQATYSRVATVPAADGNGPRFTPVGGTFEALVQDRAGNSYVQDVPAETYYNAARKGQDHIVVLDDTNRDAAYQVADESFQHRTEMQRARDASAAGVFFENLVPGVRSLQRIGMTDEQAERHARIQAGEDQAHTVASVTGDMFQLLGTAAIPIPGLGAAAGAPKSAMSLLGFADEVGQVTMNALAGSGKAGLRKGLAKMGGNVAGGAVINLPAAIQYEAAQALDYDRPLVNEVFSKDLGYDMLLGAAADIILPFGAGLGKVTGRMIGYKGRTAAKNAAAREALKQGADTSKRFRKVVEDVLWPSTVSSKTAAKRVADGLEDVAQIDPSIMTHPAWNKAKEGARGLNGFPKVVTHVDNNVNAIANRTVAKLSEPRLTKIKFKDASKTVNLDYSMAVSRAVDELKGLPNTGRIIKEIQGLTDNVKGPPSEGARRLLGYRTRLVNQVLASGSSDQHAALEVVKKHFDSVLTDANVVGSAADELRTVLGTLDDSLQAVQQLREGGLRIREYDSHTTFEDFYIGELGEAIDRVERNLEYLSGRGVLDPSQASWIRDSIEPARESLRRVAPMADTAAAVNSIRGTLRDHAAINLGDEVAAHEAFRSIPPDPTQQTSEAVAAAIKGLTPTGILVNMLRPVGNYMVDVGRVAKHVITNPEPVKGSGATHTVTRVMKLGAKADLWREHDRRTYEEKRAQFNEIRKQILAVTATEDVLADRIAKTTESFMADGDLASGVSMHTISRAYYLRSKLPPQPQGLVVDDHEFSPAEVSNFLTIFDAVEEPLSVLESVGRGTLSRDALEAINTVYPKLTADMRLRLTEEITKDPEAYRELPYRIRLDIDAFLGGGYEVSAQPHMMNHLQNRSSQTQAQAAAIGKPGAMKNTQASSAPASDSLAHLK